MGRRVKTRDWDNYDNLYNLYITLGMSFGQIAKKYNTFPNTVRRCVKRQGIEIRDKSAAQKNFLKENAHPMQGRERTEKEKLRISEGIQEHWDNLTEAEADEKREQMSERARQKWDEMGDDEKKKSIKKMHQASREKAGAGSKNENKVAELLRKQKGLKLVQRTTDYSPRNAFEIDIAVPSRSVAIEWDGAAHFEPIYGDDSLKKTIAKDQRKNKALTKAGWIVIRCRDHSTAHSLAFCQRAVNKILEVMETGQKGKVYEIDVF